MFRPKLNLPQKKRPVPDWLGGSGFWDSSAIAGNENNDDNLREGQFESTEELVPIKWHDSELGKERKVPEYEEEEETFKAQADDNACKERAGKEAAPSVSISMAEEAKLSDLEFELSREVIRLDVLQRIAKSGIPDGGRLRATTWKSNAEADSFACFVRLLSDSVDHFCQQLDNSSVGIHSTLSRLSELLKSYDEELWRHLVIINKSKFVVEGFVGGVSYPIMAKILLHGTLHATIYEADSLSTHGGGGGGGGGGPRLFRKLVEGIGETVGLSKGGCDVYATIDLEKARVGRTRIIQNEPVNPRWYETFHIYCAHMAADVIFTVKERNAIGASLVGRAYLPVQEILNGQEVERWLDICNEQRDPIEGGARIRVKVQFFDISTDRNWSRGIRSDKFPGVPYTFFSQRKGCKVSLYQDAHVPDNFIPKIPLANGRSYEPHRCWEDIFDAISNAKHLIYVTGWSVYTEITLMRDSKRQKPGGDVNLGQLLQRKANEGVRVLMLVWDDRTSVGLLKKDGLMATHDEETMNYFKDSDVHCVLCPRNPDNGGSIVQDLQISTMFTHHQKIVVVDHALPNRRSQRRRIVSFVGGIDLCDGRYDTQYHSLFRTLDTAHHDDFHQPNFAGGSIKKGGPREPWHDIHCRLEGPIAWDVLFNFEQRWRKQGGKDLLVELRDLSDTIIPPSPVTFPEDRETWNVQLFRSIDGGAAFGFPESPEDAAKAGLVSGKDNIIDRSIQDAYVNAIRRAKNFIYIENQYFLGSSFDWKNDDIKVGEIGALHLIPKELALKIVSKIEAGERFAVYVVLPMWPEGVPESASVQAILDWQRRTMEMMYTDISQALHAKHIEADPRDYLTFFCLGNRETKKSGEYAPEESPEPDTDYIRAQKARRFMIYVHSKMMIVDDEYIIIGSANINQRSMDGARDSEIAMGACQPYHLATRGPSRGQIHGFRMALWYEHLGMLDDLFLRPEDVECIRKVNRIADKYWDMYSSEMLDRDLPGHLLRYPVGVTNSGDVTQLPGSEFFPDTKACVLGAKSDYLPPILTT